MEQIELEVFNILDEIDVLDADIYSNLLEKYDEKMVNSIIEKMIDDNIFYVSKFEYYINKIASYDEAIAKNLYDAYSIDLNNVIFLSKEENNKLSIEINSILKEIRDILVMNGYDITNVSWISDVIDLFLKKCKDADTLNKIKKLYNKFLYKRNILTEGNLKFVIFVSKRYYQTGLDINEIIQLGNIGLMKACEKYDSSFSASFTTYAYYWIRQNIMKELGYINCSLSVSYHIVSLNMAMNKTINILRTMLNREPTDEEIAEHMEVSVDKVRTCMRTFAEPVCLNEPIKLASDSEDECTFMDSLEDRDSNVFHIVTNNFLSDEMLSFLRTNLTDKEFNVICHRYELGDYSFKRLRELGEEYGVSRERIRQIELKAINKIRKRGKYLKTYLD